MNDKNCIVSNVLKCKEQISAHVSSSCLSIDCEDITNALTEEIDIDKFIEWFDRNIDTFKTKQVIQPYFKRAFLTELNRGTFKLKTVVFNVSTLADVMKQKGISVSTDDTLHLDIMWGEIYRRGMSADQIALLNHKVLDYMESGQTFTDYVALIKKSNAIKVYEVDWDKVNAEYETELAKCKKILNELASEIPND